MRISLLIKTIPLNPSNPKHLLLTISTHDPRHLATLESCCSKWNLKRFHSYIRRLVLNANLLDFARDCCKWMLRVESFDKRLKIFNCNRAYHNHHLISKQPLKKVTLTSSGYEYRQPLSRAFFAVFGDQSFSFRTRRGYYQSIISCILSWAGWESLLDIHKCHLNSSRLTVTLSWPDISAACT